MDKIEFIDAVVHNGKIYKEENFKNDVLIEYIGQEILDPISREVANISQKDFQKIADIIYKKAKTINKITGLILEWEQLKEEHRIGDLQSG